MSKHSPADSVITALIDQDISGEVLVEKYAKGNETTAREVRSRVARALAAVEPEDKRTWKADDPHQPHRGSDSGAREQRAGTDQDSKEKLVHGVAQGNSAAVEA